MRLLAAVLVCVSMLAGCASGASTSVPLSIVDIPVPDDTNFASTGDLRIAPLDTLDIKVANSTGIDGTYQVNPDGQIKIPLLGQVQAKGYTTFELAGVLEAGLREQYLRNPQVTVRISETGGQQFTVEGAIGKPGMYPVRGRLSLLQAIALSGGPTPSANLEGIIIFRTIEGKRHAARFDLRKIRSGESADPVIYGNDVIVVDGQTQNDTLDNVLRGIPLLGMFVTLL